MKTTSTRPLSLALFFGLSATALANASPLERKLALEENFAKDKLGEHWTIRSGKWEIQNGAIKIDGESNDNNVASASCRIATADADFEVAFRFHEGTKALHFILNPQSEEIANSRHPLSVVVTQTSWKIVKVRDRGDPNDRNRVLARTFHPIETGEWNILRISTRANQVSSTINDGAPITAEDPSFSAAKHSIVLRVAGRGLEISEIKVWRLGEVAP